MSVYEHQILPRLIDLVLGTPGLNLWWSAGDHEYGRVFILGAFSLSGPWDNAVWGTLISHGDWTTATGGDAGWPGPGQTWMSTITNRVIPDSYYLTSKPAYFGTLAWPPVAPANVDYSMSITNIPAAYRFVFGSNPPSSTATAPVITINNLTIGTMR